MTNDQLGNDQPIDNDQGNNGPKESNDQFSNYQQITNETMPKRKYDLEQRTVKFGERILVICKKIKETSTTRPLISQLVRAGTSIGANYCEADEAVSRKDFTHKIGLCQKETKETRYWLKIVTTATPELFDEIKPLLKEVQELILIFSSILFKLRKTT